MTDRDDSSESGVNRRTFVGSAMAGAFVLRRGAISGPGDSPVPAQTQPFALDELTIDALQARMKSGQDTSQSLVEQYLARIDAIDQRGPAINCGDRAQSRRARDRVAARRRAQSRASCAARCTAFRC